MALALTTSLYTLNTVHGQDYTPHTTLSPGQRREIRNVHSINLSPPWLGLCSPG